MAFDSAGALFFDKSSKFLIFSKGHGAVFGTTSGALIKHDGTGMSYANITGQTKISNLGPGNQILLQARDGENSIVLGDDSAVKLYFNNSNG